MKTIASKAKLTAMASLLVVGMTTPVLAEGERLVLVSPGAIGVNEFLKLGQIGIEAAGATLNADVSVYESRDASTRAQNVEAAVNEGADIVAVIGFEFGDIISDLSPEHPEVNFLIMDSCIADPGPNVFCAVFREYEVSYLAGAAAALSSETGTVAAVGALDIPFLRRYTDSFELGATAVRDDINVLPAAWVGGDNPFADPVRAFTQTQLLLSNGADRVYAVTAGGNGGVFRAVSDNGNAKAIGLDVNQCDQAPGFIIDSALKRVDVVMQAAIAGILAGTQETVNSYGLAEDGLDLVTLGDNAGVSGCVLAEDQNTIDRLQEIRAQIVDGTITIPDPMAQGS